MKPMKPSKDVKRLMRKAIVDYHINCLRCGTPMDMDQGKCIKCGWENPLVKEGWI